MANSTCPLCGPVLYAPSLQRSLCTPRVFGEGACDTVSALGHALLSMVSDEPGLRRAKGQKNNTGPSALPTRVPLDPVGLRRWGCMLNAHPPGTLFELSSRQLLTSGFFRSKATLLGPARPVSSPPILSKWEIFPLKHFGLRPLLC